jgi:putative addiction module antidote
LFVSGLHGSKQVGYNVHYDRSHEQAAMTLKITSIGNSAGVVLPKERLARLLLENGDELHTLKVPDGIRLTAYDPLQAVKTVVATQITRDDRHVL